MLQFDKVNLSFGDHLLFADVSFTLQKGERCAFVGRNGSGKSTLLRLIKGELEPDSGSISHPKDYTIGYLEQHIRFTKSTIMEEAALGLPAGESDQLYKAEKILFGLGFSAEDLLAHPSVFSGGYHLRLHLAKVLIAEPSCLLLDEPTNYLDLPSIRWLSLFLRKWGGEFILISHDREFLDQVSTHTMGVHRQGVRKIKGSTLDFFSQILQEEEVYERSREKLEKKRAHMESYVERFGAKATKAKQAGARKKILERQPVLEKLAQLSHLSFSFHEAPFPGKKMLSAEGISFSYDENPLIQNCSLELHKGEKVAIIGKNGRGKSTLLRLLSQELAPKRGTLHLSENTRLGIFGQTHISRLREDHTIVDEISQANRKLTYSEVKSIAGAMLFSGELSEKKVSVLSGGEKSRVLLGKIIAHPCNLLLLDEPTHHLDIESIESLIDAIEDFSGSVIMVTHSELILRRLNPDKIIHCDEQKQTLFLGNYDAFLEKAGWDEKKKGPEPQKRPPSERKAIQKEIRQLEKALAKLESEKKEKENRLVDGDLDPVLLESFSRLEKEIEEVEAKLLTLYDRLD